MAYYSGDITATLLACIGLGFLLGIVACVLGYSVNCVKWIKYIAILTSVQIVITTVMVCRIAHI